MSQKQTTQSKNSANDNNLKQKLSNFFGKPKENKGKLKTRKIKTNYTLNLPLYPAYLSKKLNDFTPVLIEGSNKNDFKPAKDQKTKKENKNVKKGKYIAPQKKSNKTIVASGLIKKIALVLICIGLAKNGNAIYLNLSNGDRTTVNDFTTSETIDNSNENDFETDNSGNIKPFPVTDEEKQEALNQIKAYIAQDSSNFGITEQVAEIMSISSFQLNDVIQNGTFTNYLVSLKFVTKNKATYDMQFYADQNFTLSTDQMSDINKLNELLKYLQNPDMCGLFNITAMNEDAQEIMTVLNDRGNDVLYVGDTQWATANDGSIIYKIPVYNNDGSITIWASDISSTPEIDLNYSSPTKAFIAQLNDENDEASNLFSQTNLTINQSLKTINDILINFQETENEQENQQESQTKMSAKVIKKDCFEEAEAD